MRAVVVVMAVLGVASVAAAQPEDIVRPELPELEVPACPGAADIVADADIVTFPRTAAECVLGRLRAFGETVRYVRLLEERLRLDRRRIELRDRELELAREEAERLRSVTTQALARARRAEAARDAWYRRPALWFVVGAVVTVLLEMVALAALAEVSP